MVIKKIPTVYNSDWWFGINLYFLSMASQSPSLSEINNLHLTNLENTLVDDSMSIYQSILQLTLNLTFRQLLYHLLQEKSKNL
jgi:hypothetical protein